MKAKCRVPFIYGSSCLAYFERNGGYEFACQFYEEAYRFCVKLYGEENILAAVMHADELNVAATEQYGRPVYHYHLHVMALPVVDKEVRWSKRCKDPALVGTVKEVIHQVSHSKKWKSEVMTDEDGNPVLKSNGKPKLIPSYSVLQDKFHTHMTEAGFDDVERGERGSTAEHLAVMEYKVQQEQQRLQKLEERTAQEKVKYKRNRAVRMGLSELNDVGNKGLTGKRSLTEAEYTQLTAMARQSVVADAEVQRLREENTSLKNKVNSLYAELRSLKQELRELKELCMPYLDALKAAPKAVKSFIEDVLEKAQQQEKSIFYDPVKSAPKRSDNLDL